MLLDFKSFVETSGLKIKGVVQCGAHWGEEMDVYAAMNVTQVVMIEPAKKAFKILQDKFGKRKGVKLFNVAVGAKTGMVMMHTEEKNNGQSNSLLAPDGHLMQFPDIIFNGQERVELRPLDSLFIDHAKYNVLMMDVQGYEGEVIKGAQKLLKGVDIIYSEINRDSVYKGCTQIDELDHLLKDFDRVETSWAGGSWGDAIYVRRRREISPPLYGHGIVHVPKYFMPADGDPYPEDNNPPFEEWFCENYAPEGIERIYLPVMWTSFYRTNDYGKDEYAKKQLQEYLDALDPNIKYFTVVQYDDGILNDISHLDVKVFSMSGCKNAYPLPLICQPHSFRFSERKDIFCSFVGRNTHPIRKKVIEIAGANGYYFSTAPHSLREYCRILARSHLVLCPRGYGRSSFRIMEAVQYGAIPVYISDEFVKPHHRFEHYGICIKEQDIDTMHERLSIIPKDVIQLKRHMLKNVFFQDYTFEANRRLIMQNIDR